MQQVESIPAITQTRVDFPATLKALFSLTKPGVTMLLVFTAVTTAWAAAGQWASLDTLLFLALSGGLMAGGSAALNQYIERDLDAQMPRTARRVLPDGRLGSPWVALVWGVALCSTGLAISLLTLPLQATFFIVLGLIVYVPIYTLVLKRNTSMNVVIGGFAGCCPVLAGWAAVRADWPIAPFALAALVFFWTPAHFWAYALVHRESYRTAGFPMLPVESGYGGTVPHIFAHGVMMVIASVLALSGVALWVALALGIGFLVQSIDLWRKPENKKAYRLYKVSNYYLVTVFFVLTLGAVLGA